MFVYAVFNRKHNKIYIGQTNDITQRLFLHNNKTFKKSYTSRLDGKWELIYKEKVPSRKTVLIREKQLKSYRGRTYIKKHIPR